VARMGELMLVGKTDGKTPL